MILQIFKILHGICPNDLNIQFAPPSRLGVKAIIPNLNRAASQRHQTLYDTSFCCSGTSSLEYHSHRAYSSWFPAAV